MPPTPINDPIDDATVILAGRGRSYPHLSVALGEQTGVIGVLTIEAAARYLKSRDADGLVIGDGFYPHNVDALLTVIAEDSRFRDLPVGVIGRPAAMRYATCSRIWFSRTSPAVWCRGYCRSFGCTRSKRGCAGRSTRS